MAEIRHSRTIALQATSPRIVPIELPARETDPLAELAKELKSGYPLKVTPPQQMGLVILKYRETLAAARVGDAASVKAFPSIARNYIDHARAYDSGGWQAVAEQVQIDLRAVKAASTEGESEAQQPAPVTEGSASGAAWTVSQPQRYSGYSLPLYRLLCAANREGKQRPRAREVLEEWRANRPAEIEKVLADGIDYFNNKGDPKSADLEAIRKAIDRMTSAR